MTIGTRTHLVLTAVGADRAGLVERISRSIHGAGANLEDSRMAILGGEFALILLLSGAPDAVKRVQDGIDELSKELALNVTLKPTSGRAALSDHLPYRLKVSGVDRPGIVAHVSSFLAGRRINVAALESSLTYAPHSGTPMFNLRAELQVPSELALSRLRAELVQMCEEENLDSVLEGG